MICYSGQSKHGIQPRPGEITDQHLANAQTAVVNAIEPW